MEYHLSCGSAQIELSTYLRTSLRMMETYSVDLAIIMSDLLTNISVLVELGKKRNSLLNDV